MILAKQLAGAAAWGILWLLLGAAGARADTFTFSYLLTDGSVLSGVLTGTLQADMNTFDVSGYTSISFNGTRTTFVPTAFQSYSEFYAGPTAVDSSGVVTIDGSYENFIDLQTTTRTGFDFIVNVPGISFSGGKNVGIFGLSSLHDQVFLPSNLHATASTAAGTTTGAAAGSGASSPATAVPEPATLALLGLAVAGFATARRRLSRPS